MKDASATWSTKYRFLQITLKHLPTRRPITTYDPVFFSLFPQFLFFRTGSQVLAILRSGSSDHRTNEIIDALIVNDRFAWHNHFILIRGSIFVCYDRCALTDGRSLYRPSLHHIYGPLRFNPYSVRQLYLCNHWCLLFFARSIECVLLVKGVCGFVLQ